MIPLPRLGLVTVLVLTLRSAACAPPAVPVPPPPLPDERALVIGLVQDAREGLEADHRDDWVQDFDLRYADEILLSAITAAQTAVDPKALVTTLLIQAEGLLPNDGPGDPTQALHDSRLRVYFDDLIARLAVLPGGGH